MCPVDPFRVPRGKLEFDKFYTELARYSMHGNERSRGWFFWNFKCEVSDPRWCFLDAWDRGWFPKNLSLDAFSPPAARCDSWDTVFGSYWNALMVAVFCAVLFLLVLITSLCTCISVLLVRRFGRHRLGSVRELTRPLCD